MKHKDQKKLAITNRKSRRKAEAVKHLSSPKKKRPRVTIAPNAIPGPDVRIIPP